ncbi:hypothetical protein IC235_17535 [Hymenobacter sp. BT664]|uniref:LysM domain-containing protein n=1 Tax=Hymenobacter montanus TaxID=2771359 RepID=A0A927BG90_9BACT|nr:hypothetical protein [Hymenobacter montanus]MBD2769695.1 hypothetical protein [Hymenobacter montanus]
MQMTKVTVSAGQSLLDVAIGLLGGADGLFALADANGLAITDDLVPGQVLVVPDGATVSADTVAYFQDQQIRVNTTNLVRAQVPEQEGLIDHDENDHDEQDFY